MCVGSRGGRGLPCLDDGILQRLVFVCERTVFRRQLRDVFREGGILFRKLGSFRINVVFLFFELGDLVFQLFNRFRLFRARLCEIGFQFLPFGLDRCGLLLFVRELGFQLGRGTLQSGEFGGRLRGRLDLLFQLGFGFFCLVVRRLKGIKRSLPVGGGLLCGGEFGGRLFGGGLLRGEFGGQFRVGIGQVLDFRVRIRQRFCIGVGGTSRGRQGSKLCF